MLLKILKCILSLTGFATLDALFSLFYFWAGQLSYGLLIRRSSLTLLDAVHYGEVFWHGPDPLIFIGIGFLSPFMALLSLTPFLPLLRKSPFWTRAGLCLFWLGEIVTLGFFVPRFTFW